ncbi:MAG: CDP-glucose 4,6-dehydratase [Bacteroidales bacterium]
MVNLNQYKGKRVFITGHTGFKGGWLVKILNILGAEVKGYALIPNKGPCFFDALHIDHCCENVFGNILNISHLSDEIKKFQPDFIFHLAAQPLVRLSYEDPSYTFYVNAIGTANILNAVRELDKACTLVMITTDKVYHNNEWEYPYRECDPLGGYDPYSASKACAELVINSFRNSFFHPDKYAKHKKAILTARAGNVIGGGDWAQDRLIPDIVKALEQSEEIILRNPTAVRPWQHVLEPLCGYLHLGLLGGKQYQSIPKAFNFGPCAEDTLTVEEMTAMAIQLWGHGSYRIETNTEQVHEANLLKLDISLAKKELEWQPKLNASQALEWSLAWYLDYYKSPSSIAQLTDKQIDEYLSL